MYTFKYWSGSSWKQEKMLPRRMEKGRQTDHLSYRLGICRNAMEIFLGLF